MSSSEFVQDAFPDAEIGKPQKQGTQEEHGEMTRRQAIGVTGSIAALGLLGWKGYERKYLHDWAANGYTLTAENKDSSSHLNYCLAEARSGSADFRCFDAGMKIAYSQRHAFPDAMRELALLAQERFRDDPRSHTEIADSYLQQRAFASSTDPLRERKFLHQTLEEKMPKQARDGVKPALRKASEAAEPVYEHLYAYDLPQDIQEGLAYALKSVRIFAKNLADNQPESKKYLEAESGILRISGAVRMQHLPPAVTAEFTRELERMPLGGIFKEAYEQNLTALRHPIPNH